MAAKKKGAGGNLTRSEVVTVRLDPKLRYLAELASLKQRRTLSSYIEWAVQDSLSRVNIAESPDYENHQSITVQDVADKLWDVDPPDRFAKLAFNFPELLTHEEQVKWKLIRETGYLWRGQMRDSVWMWYIADENLILERLREYWDQISAVSNGDKDRSVLPSWQNPPSDLLPDLYWPPGRPRPPRPFRRPLSLVSTKE